MKKTNWALLFATFLVATMTGCNGADVGVNDNPSNPPQDTAAIEAVGEIDGFGSVIVNGERYDTDDAEITIDGEPGLESELDTGMIVEVDAKEGPNGGKKATRVKFRWKIGGILQAVDAEARTLTIMGRTILIDGDTKLADNIDEASLEPLAAGVVVRISGYKNKAGDIVATHVAVRSDMNDRPMPARLSGIVADLNLDASTFTIDDNTVDYSAASIRGIDPDLANGDKVAVKGKVKDDVLVAEIIHVFTKPERPEPTDRPKKMVIKGLVSIADNGDVTLNDYKLVGLDEAKWVNADQSDLTDGARVVVFGTKNKEGDIKVAVIILEKATTVRIMGSVEAIDTEAPSITLQGRVFSITKDTDFHDTGANKVRRFSLSDLAVGDKVIVNAFENNNDKFVAKRVVRVHGRDKPMDRFGRLHTTIASVGEGVLTTQNGIKVIITEKTRIANSVDLSMIVTGEDGDKLFITGIYRSEDTLLARSIQTLHHRPNKGDEPRDTDNRDIKIAELKARIRALLARLKNKADMNEQSSQDIQNHLNTIFDRIKDRNKDMRKPDKEEIKKMLMEIKEIVQKIRIAEEIRNRIIAFVDKLLARIDSTDAMTEA